MKFSRLIFVVTLFIGLSMQLPLVQADGLTDFKNTPRTIKDFTGKGKWLLVMFWASDCHICNKEAHEYVDFHFVHSDKDAEVLGISLDGKAKFKDAQGFIKKHSVDFQNLIGEPEYVVSVFEKNAKSRWVGTPSFLLFNPKGEIVGAQVGALPTTLVEEIINKNSKASVKK